LIWFIRFLSVCKLKIRQRRSYQIAAVLIGLLLLLKITEVGLNLWVRQALRQSLTQDPGPDTRLEAKIEWLSLGDLMAGRFRRVKLKGYQCRVSGVRLQQIQLDSSGLSLDLKVLLKEEQFFIKSISRTQIMVQITEAAATAYLAARYHQFKPQITFLPGRLQVTGVTEALGKTVPLRLEGLLQNAQPKTLRFYPEQLQIAHRWVSRNFLKYLGDRIPFEIEVLQAWPLQIEDLSLQKGFVTLQIREINI
jgi:hypothetical protein